MVWNVFRIAADLCHLTSKIILLYSIQSNRSAEGVSWLTQILYALVFLTRYSDLFVGTQQNAWNESFKIFYILSSLYTIFIMRFVFPRTREKEISWKMTAAIVAGSLLLSPFTMLIFENKRGWSFGLWIWDFSQILESVCVLPQLLLLRQTTVPTVITSFYIVFLGSYRALYLLNWIWRGLDPNDFSPDLVSVIFGIIQTALYADFAWVYWTRQRVKLRNGGVVDADDLRRGWLLDRLFGKHGVVPSSDPDEQHGTGSNEEGESALGRGSYECGSAAPPRAKWGSRGISIRADDGALDHEHERLQSSATDGASDNLDADARLRDIDELARVLDDEEDAPLGGTRATGRGEASGVRNDDWND